MLNSATRQYRHNRKEGFVIAYDRKETKEIVTGLLESLRDTEYFLTQTDPVHFPDRKKARETIARIREAIKKAEQ